MAKHLQILRMTENSRPSDPQPTEGDLASWANPVSNEQDSQTMPYNLDRYL